MPCYAALPTSSGPGVRLDQHTNAVLEMKPSEYLEVGRRPSELQLGNDW